MHIAWIELVNFRVHEALRLELSENTNVFLGPNGVGKTSILEAASYLGYLRSFRASPDKALIRSGQESAVIRAGVDDGVSEHSVEIELNADSPRKVRLNGKRPRRNADLAAVVPNVIFAPDDLELIKGGPGLRRDFLDDLMASMRPTSRAAQDDYGKALRQRNALLRRGGATDDELAAFDETLARTGARIYLDRIDLLGRLQAPLTAAHNGIVVGAPPVAWTYLAKWVDPAPPQLEALEQRLSDELESRWRIDRERTVTTTGPHRDDISILLGGRDSRNQASQGEQRSLVLSIKLAAFDLLAGTLDSAPVILLDDVLSELDEVRAGAVRERLPGRQSLVTTARADDAALLDGKLWHLPIGEPGS